MVLTLFRFGMQRENLEDSHMRHGKFFNLTGGNCLFLKLTCDIRAPTLKGPSLVPHLITMVTTWPAASGCPLCLSGLPNDGGTLRRDMSRPAMGTKRRGDDQMAVGHLTGPGVVPATSTFSLWHPKFLASSSYLHRLFGHLLKSCDPSLLICALLLQD